jgi:hypothetical protein
MAKKVALTIEQADEHALPPMLGKRTDKRAAGFAAKYGSLFQIEVDALPPEVLRSLFAEAIGEHWDEDAYTAVMEREQAERRML